METGTDPQTNTALSSGGLEEEEEEGLHKPGGSGWRKPQRYLPTYSERLYIGQI